jgi:hypothetical protein
MSKKEIIKAAVKLTRDTETFARLYRLAEGPVRLDLQTETLLVFLLDNPDLIELAKEISDDLEKSYNPSLSHSKSV